MRIEVSIVLCIERGRVRGEVLHVRRKLLSFKEEEIKYFNSTK